MKRLIIFSGLYILLMLMNGCFDPYRTIRGTGSLTTEIIDADGFTYIDQDDVINVEYGYAEEYSVELEAQENIMALIEIYVSGTTLHIDVREGYNIRPTLPVTVYINMPEFTGISNDGTGDSRNTEPFDTIGNVSFELDGTGDVDCAWDMAENVDVEIDGTGSLNIQGAGNIMYADLDGTGDFSWDGGLANAHVEIDGTGNCYFSGYAERNDLNIDGTGNFYGLNFITQKTYVDINGTGDAEVYATELLHVVIDGSGDVLYDGNPEIILEDNGSGNLINIAK